MNVQPRALSESRAREPSSARHQPSDRGSPCARCGSRTTVVDAPGAVRRAVAVARELILEDPARNPHRPSGELLTRVQRVARLRDELHATANRVARFADDVHPALDAVRITAPATSRAVLEPSHVLFQLDLTATRLIEQLRALSEADWRRTGRVGTRLMTLGDLVGGVVHSSTQDLLELLHAAPVVAPQEVLLDEGRTRRHRRGSVPASRSSWPQGSRDAS